MTAVQAHAQVNPGIADLQALFAAFGVGLDIADRIEMCTLLRHDALHRIHRLIVLRGLFGQIQCCVADHVFAD